MLLFVLCALPSAALAQTSEVDGFIYFLKSPGQHAKYPWYSERLNQKLTYNLKPFNYSVAFPEQTPKIDFRRDEQLGDLAYYTVEFGDRHVDPNDFPVTVTVSFAHGRYFGQNWVSLDDPGGKARLNIDVEQVFRSAEEQKSYIKGLYSRALDDKPNAAAEVLDTFNAVRGFVSDAGDLPAYLYLVEFVSVLRDMDNSDDFEQFNWPPVVTDYLTDLLEDMNFKNLADGDKFRVLTDIAIELGQSSSIDHQISPGITLRSLVKSFYKSAASLGVADGSDVDTNPLARKMQHAFAFICTSRGEEYEIDCMYIFFDLVTSDRAFSSSTTRGLFKDFVFYLADFSRIADTNYLTTAWQNEVQKNDTLLEYWALFYEACTVISDGEAVMRPSVRRVGELRQHCSLAKLFSESELALGVAALEAGYSSDG